MTIDSTLLPELSIHDKNILCQYYLTYMYQDTKSRSTKLESVAQTYGEILYEGINKLITSIPFTAVDIFYDLGSGLGKVVTQVFLQTQVQQAIGIEIVPALYYQSQFIAQQLNQDIPELFAANRQLKFILGSFLEMPLSDATIVLIGSPCYTPQMFNALAKIIDHAPSIHTVISLRPLLTLTRLKFKRTVRVEGSWDTTLCYVYMKR